MRQLLKLDTDTKVNEVFKNKKGKTFSALYHSIWDQWNIRIMEMASKWVEEEGDEIVYLINSWDTPAAFATFSITSAPSLVHVKKGRVSVSVEYPKVYEYFYVPSPKDEARF